MKIYTFIKTIFVIALLLVSAISCKKKTQPLTKESDNTVEIKKWVNKGDFYFDNFKNDSAIYSFNKAIALCNPPENYIDNYVYSLTVIANILQNNGDSYGSESVLTKTLPYLSKTSKPKFTYNVYTLIAYNYTHNYDYKNALLYHNKALQLAQTPFKKTVILTDIAIVYLNQNKFKEAIEILESLEKKRIKHESNPIKTVNLYSIILNNLGYCYVKTKNTKALYCLEKSLELTLTLKDEYELIGAYNTLSLYHRENNNPKLAKMYAEKAYHCAVKAKAPVYQVNCLGILLNYNEGQKLKENINLYIKIIDSITDARKRNKDQFSNIKYNSKKDKEENFELKSMKIEDELQLQRQKNRSFTSYVIISFSFFILLFLVYYIKSKGKREISNAVLKSEIRISEKLQNELTEASYQILKFADYSDLENNENKEKLLSDLNNIYTKTRTISKENSFIPTDEKFADSLKEMISGYTTSDLNIIINGLNSFSWSKIDRSKKITLFRAIQEILDQLQADYDATLASIIFKSDFKHIHVIYSNNSKKMQNELYNLEKRLQNVENRIKTIKGKLNFDKNSMSGVKVSLTFPL